MFDDIEVPEEEVDLEAAYLQDLYADLFEDDEEYDRDFGVENDV